MTFDEQYQLLWDVRRWALENKHFRLYSEIDKAIFELRRREFLPGVASAARS